jgi:hypothetical protein
MIGDSLARQLRQAMYMSLSNNFVLGGMIKDETWAYQNCRCDGQFSEHKGCRAVTRYFEKLWFPQKEGYCSQLPNNRTPFQLLSYPDWNLLQCEENSEESRPMLIIFQGGTHFMSNATIYVQKSIFPILESPGYEKCQKLGKVHMVQLSFTAQSRTLDNAYPHQSRENATEFNGYLQQFNQEHQLQFHTLDWWNLTKDAQTSDGFHFLSDVNVIMAQYIFNLAKQLSKQTTIANKTTHFDGDEDKETGKEQKPTDEKAAE